MHKGRIVTNILPDFKAERWVGLTGYGAYLREIGYALKRIPIRWEVLS
jgi:hypothetical protein